MKIFHTKQIKTWDEYTIKNKPISSLELMENASLTFTNWFTKQFPDKTNPIYVLCGNGNNGGDGLAISRLLLQAAYKVTVVIEAQPEKRSKDNSTNLELLQNRYNLKICSMANLKSLPNIEDSSIVVDALFGTGLKGELRGFFKKVVVALNHLKVTRVAIDIPSGLQGDTSSSGVIFQADYTFSFQQPKLAFLFPENQSFVGTWIVKSIGLSEEYYLHEKTDNFLLTEKIASSLYKIRDKFDHKGNFGHALLLMGGKGKIGAAMLSTLACLRAGCGLVTVYTPSCGYTILQTSVPEAMVLTDKNENYITSLPKTDGYTVAGIGCGIGTKSETQEVVFDLIENATMPLVLDADALNCIAINKSILSELPKNSVLTPHPKEFERLFGTTSNDFERNKLQREKAISLGCFIVLKGAHSCIATPEGDCYFNSTGNPGMATAGSGDVLTGIITGLLAQGYTSQAAVFLGVYLHGLSGDLAIRKLGQESLLARDLIKYLPRAFQKLPFNLKEPSNTDSRF